MPSASFGLMNSKKLLGRTAGIFKVVHVEELKAMAMEKPPYGASHLDGEFVVNDLR